MIANLYPPKAGLPLTLSKKSLPLTFEGLGLLALLEGGLRQEERRSLLAEEALVVLDEDLDDGGDLLGVALLQHVGGVGGPEEGGTHADGQVRACHHVLLHVPKICNSRFLVNIRNLETD